MVIIIVQCVLCSDSSRNLFTVTDNHRLSLAFTTSPLISVMEIALRFHNEDKTQEKFCNLHVKLMSSWSDCITTATIAEESTSWEFEETNETSEEKTDDINEDEKTDTDDKDLTQFLPNNSQIASWKTVCEGLEFKDRQFLGKFNSSPGMYAFLFGYNSEGQVRVLTFAYVDCSGLLMDRGAVSVRSFQRFGMFVDMKVQCEEPLVPLATIMPLEPLVLNLDRYYDNAIL